MENFDKIIQVGIKKAIQHYWKTRTGQLKPGRRGGKVRDRGKRAEVTGGLKGEYIEPSGELSFRKLAAAIYGRAVAYCKQRESSEKKTS